jgi:tetratricopeptide (TPR) repeat protein
LAKRTADPESAEAILRQAGTSDPNELIRLGIEAATAQRFDRGLVYLGEAYLQLSRDKDAKVPAAALSYYGLCLSMQKGRNKEAAEYCELALEKEFFNAEHYINLGQVWIRAGHRRKAVDSLQRGLAVEPTNMRLRALRESIGIRKGPVLPFLHRDNPLNVSLGKVRRQLQKKKAAKKKAPGR